MSILASAVNVLRCFSTTCSELTVTEVAQLLGLPKSNVSRLLRAMREAGLLDSARDGRGYSPGVLLVGLGELASVGQTLGARAHAAVSRVSEQCGHAGFVSARYGRRMVGLTHHAGRNPLQVGVFMGGNPLYVDACATGRALLATLHDDAVRELLDGQVSQATPQSPVTMDELFSRLAQVRERGYAESHDEAGKGIGALAVAVRDERTEEVLSFCITYPEATVDAVELRSITEALLQARSDITRTPL